MAGRKGIIVSWKNKEGVLKKGIAYQDEQAFEFSKVKKVFVRHVENTFHPAKDEKGKNIVGLYDSEKLTTIGFVD